MGTAETRTTVIGHSSTIHPSQPREMQNGDVAVEGPVTNSRVCYIYDTRMMQHECIPNFHPEQPLRISSIFAKLEEAGCTSRMVHVPCREALQEEVNLVHTQELWHTVEDFQSASRFSYFCCLQIIRF